ncbi:MAG: cyclic pyranopterin monophosphate synthase MoaC [Peptococcaceae bacterium]|nr:cyclic pyranopterin monophosphate synthase MoaC [Peptococcaceae bacterium]
MEDTPQLTHFNSEGRSRMVDVSGKSETVRLAVAQAVVNMRQETLAVILQGAAPKGDVLAVAQVAGIMAAKKTPEWIPMCHPLMLTSADIHFEVDEPHGRIRVECTVSTTGKTGVEMEALTGAAAAALTIYDMTKAIERGMEITEIRLLEKKGGKSGKWENQSTR